MLMTREFGVSSAKGLVGFEDDSRSDPIASALFEASPDAIVIVESDGVFASWNRRFTGFWGIVGAAPAHEARAVWRHVRRQLSQPRMLVAAWRAARGADFSCTVELKDGRWVELHGNRLDPSGGPSARAWFCRDVTAQLAATAARADARLIEAIDALPEVFLLFDADERLVLANSQYRNFDAPSSHLLKEGTSFETLARGNAQIHVPDWSGAEIEAYVARRLAEFRAASGAEERVLPDGRWVRISDRRTPSGGTVSLRVDITDIKLVEAELRAAKEQAEAAMAEAQRAREQLEDAIESIFEGFALYDPQGRLVLVNSQLEELYNSCGFGEAVKLGARFEENFRRSVASSAVSMSEAQIQQRLTEFREGNSSSEAQWADGRWIHSTERRMRDGGTVAIRRDITVLKHREEQLRKALIDATAASKAKSEFLANMSHELRTPLNAIIGFSEMMEAEIFGSIGSERYRNYIRDIHSSGQHLLGIINTVLDLARIEAGKIVLDEATIVIDELVEGCVVLVHEKMMRGRIDLALDIEPGLPALRVDPVRMKQVLLNLLSNAVKFTKPGGTVTLAAMTSAEGGLRVEVRDTGIGMNPLDIPQAFEPFGLVHAAHSRAYEGTGLGLPLSKMLVEEHGGRLTLTSTPGIGTVATVTVPRNRVLRNVGHKIPRD
jgi:PAS domain S-box-containing protein